jgi:hypothetical protein
MSDLTLREQAVLELIKAGLSTSAIQAALGAARSTIARVKRKAGIKGAAPVASAAPGLLSSASQQTELINLLVENARRGGPGSSASAIAALKAIGSPTNAPNELSRVGLFTFARVVSIVTSTCNHPEVQDCDDCAFVRACNVDPVKHAAAQL